MEKTEPKLRLLVAGGGTGGHLYPAFAIVEEVAARSGLADILFVGTRKGIEARKVPQRNSPIRFIWISGLHRSVKPENLIFPIKVIWSLWQAYRIIRQFKPTVVLGTGGYVSGPVLYMASRLGIPTLIQEQNSFPGIATRLLASRVNRVHLSFDSSRKYFKRQDNLVLTGNPVQRSFRVPEEKNASARFGLTVGKPTIIITGGSQGAHAINQAMLEILPRMMSMPEIQLIWSTGNADFEAIKKACSPFENRIFVQPFIDDMAAAYAISDLTICRAGAITLTELAIAGIPAILIPYPFAAGQHQLHNALDVERVGGAVVIEEAQLTPEKLYATVFNLVNNLRHLKLMKERIAATANPGATKEIVDSLFEIAFPLKS